MGGGMDGWKMDSVNLQRSNTRMYKLWFHRLSRSSIHRPLLSVVSSACMDADMPTFTFVPRKPYVKQTENTRHIIYIQTGRVTHKSAIGCVHLGICTTAAALSELVAADNSSIRAIGLRIWRQKAKLQRHLYMLNPRRKGRRWEPSVNRLDIVGVASRRQGCAWHGGGSTAEKTQQHNPKLPEHKE